MPDEDITPYELAIKTQVPLADHGGIEGNCNASKSKATNEVDNVKSVSGGTSAEYTARRLKRDNPDFLEVTKRYSRAGISTNSFALLTRCYRLTRKLTSLFFSCTGLNIVITCHLRES